MFLACFYVIVCEVIMKYFQRVLFFPVTQVKERLHKKCPTSSFIFQSSVPFIDCESTPLLSVIGFSGHTNSQGTSRYNITNLFLDLTKCYKRCHFIHLGHVAVEDVDTLKTMCKRKKHFLHKRVYLQRWCVKCRGPPGTINDKLR